MHRILPYAMRAILAGVVLAAGTGLAGAATHVRGQVTGIEGDIATVDTTDGDTVEVTLKPDFGMVVYHLISIDDLKPDDWLSIPSVQSADGHKKAVEIGVFPASMHGVGEGERDWDLGPDSAMTNASFGALRSQGSDHTIVVSYQGKEETIEVPAGTPITRFAPEPDRKLAVGDNAIFFAAETDGKMVASGAGVMEDGTPPPM